MWHFIIVEDHQDDALPFKYGILQTFSEVEVEANHIFDKYKMEQSVEAIDEWFTDVEIKDLATVLQYHQADRFTLSICEDAFSTEELCANQLLKAYEQQGQAMHVAFVDHQFSRGPSVEINGTLFSHEAHGEALIHQHIDRISAPRQFFFVSKLLSQSSGGEALQNLENNYGKKVVKLYKPIPHETRTFDKDYHNAIKGWKETLRNLAKEYAQYLPEAEKQTLRNYRAGDTMPRITTNDGIEWSLPTFLAGWIKADHQALSEAELVHVIRYELFTADLSIAFSEAFAIRAIKDLTHKPAGSYHPINEVPSGVREQIAKLRQTLGLSHDDLMAQDFQRWSRIQQYLENFISLSDALQRVQQEKEDWESSRELEQRLSSLRKAAFQFTGEIDQGELEGQIIEGSREFFESIMIPQKLNSPAMEIYTLGLRQIAATEGMKMRAFDLPLYWPSLRVEYNFPLVDLFQSNFSDLLFRIRKHAGVNEVSVAFLAEWSTVPAIDYQNYIVGLCDNYLLLGNKGKPFPSNAFGETQGPPSISQAFRGFHFFGEYFVLVKTGGQWHFYDCTQQPYRALDWKTGLTLLPTPLRALLENAPGEYCSFYLFKTKGYRPRPR